MTVVLGQDAKLPCFYRGDPGEQVGQVAWLRVDAGAAARELALLHSEYGLHVSAAYEGRVERPPLPRIPQDGAVLLRNAVQADEGEYECRVSTFPAGSFQARLRLRVLGKRGCRAEAGAGVGAGQEQEGGRGRHHGPPAHPRGRDSIPLAQPWGDPIRYEVPHSVDGKPPSRFLSPFGFTGPGLIPSQSCPLLFAPRTSQHPSSCVPTLVSHLQCLSRSSHSYPAHAPSHVTPDPQ